MVPRLGSEQAGWRLEHTYTDLPQLFWSAAAPTPVREPRLVVFNRPLAALLGLDAETLAGPEGAAIFAGNDHSVRRPFRHSTERAGAVAVLAARRRAGRARADAA
jgi:uncharacterized protein YdiU (UPF0061 family)